MLGIVARLHHLLRHAPAADLDRAAHWVALGLRVADSDAGLGRLAGRRRSDCGGGVAISVFRWSGVQRNHISPEKCFRRAFRSCGMDAKSLPLM